MPELLKWGQTRPFVVTVQAGNVAGFIRAARKDRKAAEELRLWELAMLMAHPTDENRRQLLLRFKSWQGMSLKRLMRAFVQRQALADERRHKRQCLRSAQRVAADVVSA